MKSLKDMKLQGAQPPMPKKPMAVTGKQVGSPAALMKKAPAKPAGGQD